MRKKNGFTLVELLATIVVLALVLSIVAYVVISSLNKAKEKSYQVTINEITSNADSYLQERSGELFFIEVPQKPDLEYQCITVNNLVDKGYLKDTIESSKVAEDEMVDRDNYIYIERNRATKAVTESSYVKNDDTEKMKLCNKAINAMGEITFSSNPDFDSWSTSKKVTITYRVKNVNDVKRLNEYIYNYSFKNGEPHGEGYYVDLNNGVVRDINITENGNLDAKIIFDGNGLATNSVEIKNIDTVGPTVTESYSGNTTVKQTVTIPLVMTDSGIGPNLESFTKEDLTITIGGTEITDFSLDHKSNNNYELKINDLEHAGALIIVIDAGKIDDELGNLNTRIELKPSVSFSNTYTISYDGNGGTSPTATSVQYNKKYGTLPTSTRTGYTLDGWYTAKTGGTKVTTNTVFSDTADKTLYAHWTANTYTVSFDSNGGSTPKPATLSVTYGSKYGTMPTTSRTNYLFNGWYTAKTGGTKVTKDTVYSDTANKTLYAVWTYNPPATPTPTPKPSTKPKIFTPAPSSSSGCDDDSPGNQNPCDYGACCGDCGGGTTCFVAGTKVYTPYGEKNIETLRPGDLVYSKSENALSITTDKVFTNYVRISYENLYKIYTENEVLTVTPEHPFYVKDSGWVKTRNLKVDDTLLNIFGNDVKIKQIEIIINYSGTKVYNLNVANNHTYFVGNDSIWVHNKCCGNGGR